MLRYMYTITDWLGTICAILSPVIIVHWLMQAMGVEAFQGFLDFFQPFVKPLNAGQLYLARPLPDEDPNAPFLGPGTLPIPIPHYRVQDIDTEEDWVRAELMFAALAATKGERLHRRAGVAFVAAMLVMGLSGAGIAAATGEGGSVIGGLLAAYLTLSGLLVVRPPTPGLRRLSLAAVSVGLPLGLASLASGVSTLAAGSLVRNGVPVPMIFLFATVALSSVAGDFRRLRSGPARGRRKLAAHLWRMCFALFIASGSFFLGQADEIPEPLRVWPVLITLAVLPLVAIPYYLWRVRGRRVVGRLGVESA